MGSSYYPDYEDEFGVTSAQLRTALATPSSTAHTLATLAHGLKGDEKRVLTEVRGDIAADVAAHPKRSFNSVEDLSAKGSFAVGVMLRYARAADDYDRSISSINALIRSRTARIMNLPEFRDGDLDPDGYRRSVKEEYRPKYNHAVKLLNGETDEVERMLRSPMKPGDIKSLILDGFIPMTAADLYPGVKLTDADKRKAYAADVREGTIPDFATMPPGTSQQWLDEHPEVRADLHLFDADPPGEGDSKDAAAWFSGLSALSQLAVSVLHADDLGNRDGIPAWSRDLANRERLDDIRAILEAEPQSDADKDKLASLDQIERTLELGDRQLLLLDPWSGKRMHAAVAVGNVDTADHVSVFTPGFTSTVDGSLHGYDADMAALRDQANWRLFQAGRGDETVATVTWIGYDAPQWNEILGSGSVASSGRAEEGGDDLAAFLTGINDSRPTDPHLSALGHSYGSVTTGYALQHHGTGVDDAIVFGSPGLGTSERSKIDVPTGHLYRVEAKNDPVADLAAFGQDPTWMSDTHGLSAKDAMVGKEEFDESTGHSAYLSPGTTSQYNMAVTIAGLPDEQVDDDGHGAGDILTWWPGFVPESWR